MTCLRYVIIILICSLCPPFLPAGTAAAVREERSTKRNSSYQTIPETSYHKVFSAFVEKKLGKKASDVAVLRMKIMGDGPVPAGKVTFQLFQKEQRKLERQVNLTALIYVDGIETKKVRLTGWVDAFDSVVCVSRNMKRGEILGEDDLYMSRKNISYLPSNILTEKEKAIGLALKHQIKADTPLKEWMLERPPVVERGDMVMILAESGGLRVTVPGKILEKGYRGQLVQVQNTMSRKNIYAKVIDEATVMVDF
jgi:flagella basal body P-ring formation protein FlgA